MSRITVVQAPAGFGKTTLLAQWYRQLQAQGRRVGWLTIDAGEKSAPDLLGYLEGILDGMVLERTVVGPLQGSSHSDSQRPGQMPAHEVQEQPHTARGAKPNAVIARLANRLCDEGGAPILLLDDVHLLDSDAFATLGRFIAVAPATTRFVLALRKSRSSIWRAGARWGSYMKSMLWRCGSVAMSCAHCST